MSFRLTVAAMYDNFPGVERGGGDLDRANHLVIVAAHVLGLRGVDYERLGGARIFASIHCELPSILNYKMRQRGCQQLKPKD